MCIIFFYKNISNLIKALIQVFRVVIYTTLSLPFLLVFLLCQCSSIQPENKQPKGPNRNDNNCHTNFHFRNRGKDSCSSDANFNSLTMSFQGCNLEYQKGRGSPGHDPGSLENRNCEKGGKEDNWKSSNGELDSCESYSTHGSNEGLEGQWVLIFFCACAWANLLFILIIILL